MSIQIKFNLTKLKKIRQWLVRKLTKSPFSLFVSNNRSLHKTKDHYQKQNIPTARLFTSKKDKINKQIFFKHLTWKKGLYMLSGLLALFTLVLAIYTFNIGYLFAPVPINVRLTNVSPHSLTITWLTKRPSRGRVAYTTTADLTSNVAWAYDDKDKQIVKAQAYQAYIKQENVSQISISIDSAALDKPKVSFWQAKRYYTHSVTLTNLEDKQTYFFKLNDYLYDWQAKNVTTRLSEIDAYLSPLQKFTATTASQPSELPVPKPSYGQVTVADQSKINDWLVFSLIEIPSTMPNGQIITTVSTPLSSLINEQGGYYFDLSNITTDLGVPLQINDSAGINQYVFLEGADQTYQQITTLDHNAPVPAIDITENVLSSKTVIQANSPYVLGVQAVVDSSSSKTASVVSIEESNSPKLYKNSRSFNDADADKEGLTYLQVCTGCWGGQDGKTCLTPAQACGMAGDTPTALTDGWDIWTCSDKPSLTKTFINNNFVIPVKDSLAKRKWPLSATDVLGENAPTITNVNKLPSIGVVDVYKIESSKNGVDFTPQSTKKFFENTQMVQVYVWQKYTQAQVENLFGGTTSGTTEPGTTLPPIATAPAPGTELADTELQAYKNSAKAYRKFACSESGRSRLSGEVGAGSSLVAPTPVVPTPAVGDDCSAGISVGYCLNNPSTYPTTNYCGRDSKVAAPQEDDTCNFDSTPIKYTFNSGAWEAAVVGTATPVPTSESTGFYKSLEEIDALCAIEINLGSCFIDKEERESLHECVAGKTKSTIFTKNLTKIKKDDICTNSDFIRRNISSIWFVGSVLPAQQLVPVPGVECVPAVGAYLSQGGEIINYCTSDKVWESKACSSSVKGTPVIGYQCEKSTGKWSMKKLPQKKNEQCTVGDTRLDNDPSILHYCEYATVSSNSFWYEKGCPNFWGANYIVNYSCITPRGINEKGRWCNTFIENCDNSFEEKVRECTVYLADKATLYSCKNEERKVVTCDKSNEKLVVNEYKCIKREDTFVWSEGFDFLDSVAEEKECTTPNQGYISSVDPSTLYYCYSGVTTLYWTVAVCSNDWLFSKTGETAGFRCVSQVTSEGYVYNDYSYRWCPASSPSCVDTNINGRPTSIGAAKTSSKKNAQMPDPPGTPANADLALAPTCQPRAGKCLCDSNGNTTCVGEATKVTGEVPTIPSDIIQNNWSVLAATDQDQTKEVIINGDGYYVTSPQSGVYLIEDTQTGAKYTAHLYNDAYNIVYLDTDNSGYFNPRRDQALQLDNTRYRFKQITQSHDVVIKPGYNFISFPYIFKDGFANDKQSKYYFSRQKFLEIMNEDLPASMSITLMSRFANGNFDDTVAFRADLQQTYDQDNGIVPGEGYVVRLNGHRPVVKQFQFFVPETSTPLQLGIGWNLVGVYSPQSKYTAGDFIDRVNGEQTFKGRLENITRWQNGLYDGLEVSGGVEFGFDFALDPFSAYFMRVQDQDGEGCGVGGCGKINP